MSAGSPLADLAPARTPDGLTTDDRAPAAGSFAPRPPVGFQPGGGTSAEQADQVDVRGVLRGGGPFGPEQVRQLEQAVAGTQPAEVRQHLQELENEIGPVGEGGTDRQNTAAGVTHYLLGQHEPAAERLNEVDGDGFADYYLALALTSLKDWDGALAAYDEAAGNGFDEVQCELEKAGVVRQAGDTEKADEMLTAVSRKAATRAEYSYQKGCVMADRGDTLGAVEYFERAVDMDARHSKAMFRLAGLMDLLGEDEAAVRLYEQSLSKPPLFLGALINLGLLYEDAENYPAAAYCFRRVLQVYPTHERALLFLKDVAAATSMYYDEEAMRRQRELEQADAHPDHGLRADGPEPERFGAGRHRHPRRPVPHERGRTAGGQELRRHLAERDPGDPGAAGPADRAAGRAGRRGRRRVRLRRRVRGGPERVRGGRRGRVPAAAGNLPAGRRHPGRGPVGRAGGRQDGVHVRRHLPGGAGQAGAPGQRPEPVRPGPASA